MVVVAVAVGKLFGFEDVLVFFLETMKTRRDETNNNMIQRAQAGVTPYPTNRRHRATNFITMFDTTLLPWNAPVDGCNNMHCYTSSKGTFLYKPHSDIGMVGRSAAGYLAQRKRM